MSPERMKRVSKGNPCPICGKPDWCLVAPDRFTAICARIEEGAIKKCGDAGFLHILRDRHNGHDRHKYRVNTRRLVTHASVSKSTRKDFGQLAELYRQLLTDDRLNRLATALGVSAASLNRLNVGWDGKAYTFSMANDFGKTIGIRRRFLNGRKVSVKGSKSGLFIPRELSIDGFLLVCEGATDTAAALDLGFSAIGRPNCNSRIDLVLRFAKGLNVVAISDNDHSGKAGAEKLAARLALCCPSVRIVYPPASIRDLRKWLHAGLTTDELNRALFNAEPMRTRIRLKRSRTDTEQING